MRPVPSWNRCVCGRLWSSRSTGCHSCPSRPTVFLHCPLAQSFVLRFDLRPALQINATGCHSFSSAASKRSRDSQNISHVRTYKMGRGNQGGKSPSSFRALLFLTSLGYFSHIRIFLCPPFAGISVFICLTSRLNAVSLKDKDLKEPLLCQRADAKIMNK